MSDTMYRCDNDGHIDPCRVLAEAECSSCGWDGLVQGRNCPDCSRFVTMTGGNACPECEQTIDRCDIDGCEPCAEWRTFQTESAVLLAEWNALREPYTGPDLGSCPDCGLKWRAEWDWFGHSDAAGHPHRREGPPVLELGCKCGGLAVKVARDTSTETITAGISAAFDEYGETIVTCDGYIPGGANAD